jgi:hypothetical protein
MLGIVEFREGQSFQGGSDVSREKQDGSALDDKEVDKPFILSFDAF